MVSLVLSVVLGGSVMPAGDSAAVELFPTRAFRRVATDDQRAAERRLLDAPEAQRTCLGGTRGPLLLGAGAIAAIVGIPILAYGQYKADRPQAKDGMIDPESTFPIYAGAFLTAGAVAMLVTGSIFLMRDARPCDPAPQMAASTGSS